MAKIDVNTLTSEKIRNELNRTKYNNKFKGIFKSSLYVLIIIAAIGGLLAMFVTPIVQVSSNSMSPYYNNGDILATIKTKKISSGDVIVFYYGNKILVSRVAGISGDDITIKENGLVLVNGNEFNSEYATNIETTVDDIKYPYQVPAESYFVINDNREVLTDSRTLEVGSIKQDDLIGKVLFRIFRGK